MFYNLNRWICVRIDLIGASFSAGLAAYLVYGRGVQEASNIGFSLTMAVGFTRMFYNLNRWICVRIDLIGAAFSAGLAAYLVYGRGVQEASNIGFSLTMAVGFSSMILWWVRILNDVEVNGELFPCLTPYVSNRFV
ncbi:hypothetical protein AZE42_08495 [Rhizopogon vesiculosus]|uniref:Uncharacterized protein n=1 Tax=Rhizopogon vesiculosus TaxID=180088 RepID=A0A1J8QGA1_9AGAM|nr:hypothetical protein AZE42_08495 [Rhizopogon vesiculosus]